MGRSGDGKGKLPIQGLLSALAARTGIFRTNRNEGPVGLGTEDEVCFLVLLMPTGIGSGVGLGNYAAQDTFGKTVSSYSKTQKFEDMVYIFTISAL